MRRLQFVSLLVGAILAGNASADLQIDTQSTEREWISPGISNDGFFSAADLGALPSTALNRFGLRYNLTLPGLNGGLSPDWYQFTISTPTTIGVTLNSWGAGYDSGSASGQPIVGLFDAQGAIDGFPLLESSTLISGLYRYERMQTATLAPGAYAFAVSGFHGDNNDYYYNGGASYNWPYALTVHAGGSPAAPDTSARETEWIAPGFSNDSFSTASNLGVLGTGSREVHGLRYTAGSHQRLSGGVSPDWYKFTINTPMVLEVALNTWGTGYTSANPIVGLFDVQAAIDGFPLQESVTLASGIDQYERIQSTTLPPGTYALAVSGFDGDDNNYYNDGGASYNWPYQLKLELTTPILPGDFDEDGLVEADDLTQWMNGFGIAPASHMQGDADGDLDADGADFLEWQRQVGSLPVIMAAASIPEPGATALLSLAGARLMLLRARRCRAAENR